MPPREGLLLTAPREAPLRIEDREELIFVLSEAAELEHSLTCAYLFAAWSLKVDRDEGLTDEQLQAVRGWERSIATIAVQEMTHLALVSNLLTALGGAPHFARPNLPQRTRYYPQDVQISLEPFSLTTIRHFTYLERPEGMEYADAPEFAPIPRTAVPWHAPGRIIPRGQEFATVGHLYRGIANGFRALVEAHGEERVFIGPLRGQATQADFGFPDLRPITSLADALDAIERIVEQGEGAKGEWADAHYGRFLAIQEEYKALLAQDPEFQPARPVLPNPFVRQPFDCDPVNVISEPFTIDVADLGNAAYASMLQALARTFAHSSENEAELSTLNDISVLAMFRLLKPIGTLLTKLPAGPNYPGMTAGMSFELYRSLHLLPHRHAAWALLHERYWELGAHADTLSGEAPTPEAAKVLGEVAGGFADIATKLADRIREQDLG